MPIRPTADGTLPPRLSGVGWHITEGALVTRFFQSYAPFSSQQPFQDSRSFTLMPLSLSSLTSQLRFRYHCAVNNSAHIASFDLQLELWVNGQRIWESSEYSSIPKEKTVELSLNTTFLEWKVKCGALVLKGETPRVHQRIDVQVSISQISFDVLAPATTLQARNAAAFSAGAQADRDWLPISTILARNPVYGLVTESRNVSGIIHSVIYDRHFRFPVAGFDHASVRNGEAGYHGFQDYEDPQCWDISSSVVDATRNRKTMSIEPKRFAPRDPKTRYLVSAWIKPHPNGQGGQIGFGTAAKAITAEHENWQYVEWITDKPDPAQKPFARCDGEIDHFRFGPIDAPFSATVYDPGRHLVTATVEPNGKITRYLYDRLQRLVATIDADEKITSFRSESHARDHEQRFKQERPNQSLGITPRTGGRYYQRFPSPTFAENGGEQQLFSDIAEANYGIRFKVKTLRNALDSPFFGIAFGDAQVVSDDRGLISLYTHKDTLSKCFPGPGSSDFVEWLLVVIDQTAFFFVDGRQVFREVFSARLGKSLSVFWRPSELSVFFEDICVLCDPIMGVSYADGLGRTIQVQHPNPEATGVVATQTLYDSWGHPAIQTKPACIDGGLVYCQDLVTHFDASSGTMTGKIADYYNRPDIRTPDQTSTDHQYAFTRSVTESSPLARTIEVSAPGSEFTIGSPYTLRVDFHQTPETSRLLTDIHLQDLAGQYFSRTTRYPFERDRHAILAQIFDLQGNVIAQRHGSDENGLTSSHSVTYGANNVQRLAYPPNYFSTSNTAEKNQFIASESTDILGQVIQRSECDRGQQQFIYDRSGRLRFQLDAAGATETPHRILYWRYDSLGRSIEDGWIRQNWDRDQLQRHADSDASWPTASAKASTPQTLSVWKNRYLYDATPGNASSRADLNYQKLEQLLAAATQGDADKWSEADQETWKILIKVSHREKEGDWLKDYRSSIDVAAINSISNSVLNRIDQLWKRFSNGKFGFHVQKKIWQECNAPEGYSGRQSFGVSVGWYKTDRWIRSGEIQYNLAAPMGHLPAIGIYSALSCNDWSVALSGLNALYSHFQEGKDDEGPPSQSQYLQGRLGQMISSNDEGQEIRESYEYDRDGKVTAIHLAVEGYDDIVRTTRYHYDHSGNVVKITYPSKIGSSTPFEVYHYYNAMGQLASVGTAADPAFYAAYDYNIDGTVSIEYLNQRRLQRHYRYGFQRRLLGIKDLSLSVPQGQQVLFAEELSYRDAENHFHGGNITQATFSDSMLNTPHRYAYSYDEHDRLLSAKAATVKPQTTLSGNWDVEGIDGKPIGYDANGNIISITQRGTAQEYFYEAGSNRLARTDQADYHYDANGRLIFSRHHNVRLEYEPLTGLTREIQAVPQTEGTVQNRTIKLRHGAQRQRVLKTAISRDVSQSDLSLSPGSDYTGMPVSLTERRTSETVRTTLYLHGANAYPLCEESRESGRTTRESTIAPATTVDFPETRNSADYIYGVGGLIAMREDEHIYFFSKDHLGSVRMVLDQNSQICAAFDYLPFGELTIPNSDSVRRFRYLYTGQEFDWETGLYNYRARMYDPQLGRFCAPDPAHQYASPYEYVGNNPINLVDPTGTSAVAEVLKGLGKAVGWGALSGGAAGIVSTIQNVKGSNDAGYIAGQLAIAAGIGALGGVVGGAIGAALDVKITGKFVKYWAEQQRFSASGKLLTWSSGHIRALGAVKGAITGWVGSLASQVTANIVSEIRHQNVNWAGTLAAASGAGVFFGAMGGVLGATRMRWKEYAVVPAVPGGYQVLKTNTLQLPHLNQHLKIIATFGQDVGPWIVAGLGVAGSIVPSEVP